MIKRPHGDAAFFDFWCIRSYSFLNAAHAQSVRRDGITDKVPFFADLSVSKTHFTDKPAFSNDLSVNFWPLWWGFTDKAGFLEHLSVKPGPKRLNFYGQTAIFDHFVRNRHFSSKPFTDRRPIFIDVSVNGSNFVKCSTRSIGTSRSDYGQMAVLGMFVRKILLYIGSSAFSKKIKFKI